MNSQRPGAAASAWLAALASLAAALSAITLVSANTWYTHAVFFAVLVAGVGVLVRRVSTRAVVVLPAQLLVVVIAAVWLYAGSTTWFGFPTWASVEKFARLFLEFGQTVYRAAAPLPANTGVQVTLTLITVAVVLLVDHIAVTHAAPAAAGLVLLTVYLTAAANSTAALHPAFFLVAAVGWLILLAHHARAGMQRWADATGSARSTVVTGAVLDGSDDTATRFGVVARRLGTFGVLSALLLAGVLPHLPTRYVLDGLARGDRAGGSGPARVGFSSTLDVGRSLVAGNAAVLFRYRTTAAAGVPLRVLATTSYDGTTWTRPSPELGGASRLDVDPGVPRTERVLTVQDYLLDPPALATPQPITAGDFGGVSWRIDQSTHDVYVQARPGAYSTTYLELTLSPDLLRDGVDGRAGPDPLPASVRGEALAVDPAASAAVTNAVYQARTVAGLSAQSSPYDQAVAVQAWLRERGGFEYTFELTPVTGAGGAPLDPVSSFLLTKRGYCVQFSSAMIMMARAAGIPARMAIGFLPGVVKDGLYTVTASDAHSWPELYFPGAGWVRFDPTPTARSGAAPAWSVTPTAGPTAAPTSSATPSSLPGDAGAPSERERVTPGDGLSVPEPGLVERIQTWVTEPAHLLLVALLLGLLGTLVLPVTAWLVRRSRTRGAAREAQRVEAAWSELTGRLGDLGVPAPAGGTLRDAQRHYVDQAHLQGAPLQALGTLVASVEQARYARPGTDVPAGAPQQAHEVLTAVARGRSWRLRLRALLLPTDGRLFWSSTMARTNRWAGVVAESVTRRLTRGQSR